PPPPPPDEETPEVPLPQEAPQAERVGYYESCFGVPRAPGPPIGVSAEVVVPVSGGASGAPSMPVVSKSSDEKAWLVVAVVAGIGLPPLVRASGKPARPPALARCL